MLYWVHSNTSNAWPVSLLSVRLVVGIVCLEKRFLSSLSTSNDSNHGSAGSLDGLSHARWHSNTGLLAILGVTNDDSTGARGSCKGATVTHLSFNVGDDGSFWHAVDRDDIADSQGSFRSSMNILTGVHALDSDEILSVLLVFVLVSENDFGKRCATARIVHDVLHDSTNVSFTLCEVQGSETSWGDSLRGVGLEDAARSAPLHYSEEID